MREADTGGAPLVIFDGTCGLCNRFVVFAIKRNRRQPLQFMSNHSPRAQALLRARGLAGVDAETIVVINGSESLVKSDAGLFVLSHLSWPYSMARILRIIPRMLRDWGYTIVSRNRLRLFGKVGECELLQPEQRAQIIE